MTVRLHIERLVIEGLDLAPADAARFGAGLEEALGASFAADERIDWSGFAAPALPPLDLVRAPRDGARGLGRQVGETLYGGLKR